MADAFRLCVMTPDLRVWDGVVQTVVATGPNGEFGVLPGHVAYVTPIQPGALVIEADSVRQIHATGQGFAQVGTDRVSIVLSSCEDAAKLDGPAIEKVVAAAEKMLCEADPEEPRWHDARFEQEMGLGRLAAIARLGVSASH
jgi:F-type H+-transporting ATPase subunit epsilon